MHTICSVVALAACLAPAFLSAQASPIDRTYAVAGCGTGVAGPVLCLSGDITLRYTAQSDGTRGVDLNGWLTPAPAPGFAADTLRGEGAGAYLTLGESRYASFGASSLSYPGVTLVRAPVAFPVFAIFELPAVTLDLSAIRFDRLVYTYSYLPAGSTSRDLVTFAVTATPEPATLALTLGGLALVGVIARRRRTV